MKSIRKRLTISLLASLGLVWIVSQFFVYRAIEQASTKSFDRDIEPIEENVRYHVRPDFGGPGNDFGPPPNQQRESSYPSDKDNPLLTDPPVNPPSRNPRREPFTPEQYSLHVKRFEQVGSGLYFQVIKVDDGETMFKSASLGQFELSIKPALTENATFWDAKLPNGEPVRVMAKNNGFVPNSNSSQRRFGPPRIQEATMLIAVNRAELDATLNRYLMAFAAAGLIGACVTIVLVNTLLGYGLSPLNELAAKMRGIDERSLNQRINSENCPKELLPITRCLNDLLDRLQQSFDRERRFSSDASHELRTPVAELRTVADVAIKWPDRLPPETFYQIQSISRRMASTLDGLLKLARFDAGRIPKRKTALRLSEFVSSIWTHHAERALFRNISLDLAIDSSLTIQTDKELLSLILNNLLSNLSTYAPANSIASVSGVMSVDNTLQLAIANEAPELATDEASQLFQRFWRKDSSRTSPEHCGLGLSIALAAAKALDLELAAKIDAEHLLTFTLQPLELCTES